MVVNVTPDPEQRTMTPDDTPATLTQPERALMPREHKEVVLTVLAHFDPSYVGAMARVPGDTRLSRAEPEFALPGGERRVLDDPFLSSKPLELRVDPIRKVVTIDAGSGVARVTIDGKPLDAHVVEELSAMEVDRGVVIDIADRVALLLHHRTSASPKSPQEELGLVGVSEAMEKLRQTSREVAATPSNILICGESGVGKELVARTIHQLSDRGSRTLEVLNMAAMTPSLAASGLFGHNRDAFTGADHNRVGALERADGGALILDAAEDTPADVQPLLLRALESGEFTPVGATAKKRVDVRVLAATDADLDAAITSDDPRTALLRHLADVRVDVPPLRTRREDIGVLVLHFLRQEFARMGVSHHLEADTHRSWLSASTVARLARYDWPGNVRQLRNVTRQLAILTCDASFFGEGVDIDALLPAMPDENSMADTLDASPSHEHSDAVSEDKLIEALREHAWQLAPTAKALGVSRTNLYAMLERSSKIRKAVDLSAAEIEDALDLHERDITRAALALEVSEHALGIRMKALDITS